MRKFFNPQTDTLLWGNHDLLFVLSALGSSRAQRIQIAHRDAEKILRELGNDELANSIGEIAQRCRPGVEGFRRRFLRALVKDKTILAKFNVWLQSHPEIQELTLWVIQNAKLFHISSQKVFYIHAGIPIRKGAPLYSSKKLAKIDSQLRAILRKRKLKDPLLTILDSTKLSPLRVGRWLEKIKDPKAFCQKFKAIAMVVGHSPMSVSSIENERRPILRHDFRLLNSEICAPSFLVVTADRLTSLIHYGNKWYQYERKL